MPFTPFHFGPHACLALPLSRYIDVPTFIAANVAVDIEPLLVMACGLDYPVHGYCHTIFVGSLVGMLLGIVMIRFCTYLAKAMSLVGLSYTTSPLKMILSGIGGVWLHVLFDAPLYPDIRPFFPFSSNPLYGIVSMNAVYGASAFLFLPGALIYLRIVCKTRAEGRSSP